MNGSDTELDAAARPLRVLHCLWRGEVGGAERAVYQLVRQQLQDDSLAPALLFAQAGGPYWQQASGLACSVRALDLPSGLAAHMIPRIAGAMRPFDVHHLHSAEPLFMFASAACRGACRVYTHRGATNTRSFLKGVRNAATAAVLRRSFHAFSGNTQHAASFAAELFGIDPGRFRVTYNGLDFALLEPRRPPEEVRQELGLEATDFVLGTAAVLKDWKRIDRLVRALQGVPNSRVRLLIVGDGGERGALERLASVSGVRERVVFAGVKEHVGDYLQVMDAFSLPSSAYESFGNAAVEAMGMGLPTVVFSDGGGLVEHITPGKTGFVVADQAELENVVGRLADDPSLGREIGARARLDVRNRYTPAAAAQRYRCLYAAALEVRPAGPGPSLRQGSP